MKLSKSQSEGAPISLAKDTMTAVPGNTTQPIELSDDDDEITIVEDTTPKKPKISKAPKQCLNVQCKNGKEFIDGVPAFVLSYYKVRKKNGLKVCEECFGEACTFYTDLKEKLVNAESICRSVPCQPYTPVLNIDSDDDDLSPDDEEEPLSLETIKMIENDFTSIALDVMEKCKVSLQVNDAYETLLEGIKEFKESSDEHFEQLDNFQFELDNIRKQIYEPFRPRIQEVTSLLIDEVQPKEDDDRVESVNDTVEETACSSSSSSNISEKHITEEDSTEITAEQKDSQDVVAVSEEVMVPPSNLPSASDPVVWAKLKPGEVVFAMKHSYRYAWKKGVIVNIFKDKGYNEYQLKIDVTNPKISNPSRILPGKCLAYPIPSLFRFTVGLRVIAVYKEENETLNKYQYYSGVIAEPPKVMNKFRYLIFFDDGCTQYVPHEYVRLICEPSSNAWEDVPLESRSFIQNYLLKYPERPMVKLQPSMMIKVEFQNKWLQAKVIDVDGSLVKLHFSDSHTEWMYRGSARLAPLYKELEAAKHRMETGDRVRKIAGNVLNNVPYVEYTHNTDQEDVAVNRQLEPRAVARKSTYTKEHSKTEKPVAWKPSSIPGKVEIKKLTTSVVPKKFTAHQCGPICINWTNYNSNEVRKVGPLAIPLHYGFRRLVTNFSNGKHNVMYKAPCGRHLRNMEEVHMYLRITKSEMTVDFFDFDYWVRCQAEFVIERCNISIPDISQRKEKCSIACVNYIDGNLPDFCGYMTERAPRENVNLNLDPEFLSGCDCTDDCQDKEKCSCWQLTIEGQKLLPQGIRVMDPNIGYHYRRLTERAITGIYECNPQCKCSKRTCLNRVVQHPLSQKLQLFKTEMKGWGIRCINDIPQGAFICVYAGHLLTDKEANEEGKNYGDEYLAELDYIEVIERIKEDYESDVPEDLLEETEAEKQEFPRRTRRRHKSESPESFSDDEEVHATEPNTFEDIRSRLRERKKPSKAQNEENNKPKEKTQPFSIRTYYGDNEGDVFIMDAKSSGNIGRYLNHSCMPNVFVQNVFVDTHDLRFPWVAFFALTHITAGSELTWDYNYDIGSVEGKVKYCYCGSQQCRGRLL